MSFKYRKLDNAAQQIRVLELLSGRWDDEVLCQLDTISLLRDEEESRPYDALSYAWEGQRPCVPVKIDGLAFDVTPNVYAFLRRHRDRERSLRIWIDGMCINQDDVRERGSQVALMHEVYGRARYVYIWFGDLYDAESLCDPSRVPTYAYRQAICELLSMSMDPNADELPEEATNSDGADSERGSSFNIDRADQAYCHRIMTKVMPGFRGDAKTTLVDVSASEWDCLAYPGLGFVEGFFLFIQMVFSPWWTRLWVLQELCLSRVDPIACLGPHRKSFTSISEFAGSKAEHITMMVQRDIPSVLQPESLGTRLEHIKDVRNKYSAFFWTRKHRQISTVAAKTTLGMMDPVFDWLNSSCLYQTSDTRDHLYAIRGLVAPFWRLTITPDYSVDAKEIFARTTKAMILQSGDLRYLYYARGLTKNFAAAVPSWSVSWVDGGPGHSTWRPRKVDLCGSLVNGPTYVKGCHALQAMLRFPCFLIDDPLVIRIPVLSKKCKIIDFTTWRPHKGVELPNYQRYVLDCGRLATRHDIDTSGQVFCKTLFPQELEKFDGYPWYRNWPDDLATRWVQSVISNRHPADEAESYQPAHELRFPLEDMVSRPRGQRLHFFVTSTGRCGSALFQVKNGDEIRAIPGCEHAVVLRRSGNAVSGDTTDLRYSLVGFCYMADFRVISWAEPFDHRSWSSDGRNPSISGPDGELFKVDSVVLD